MKRTGHTITYSFIAGLCLLGAVSCSSTSSSKEIVVGISTGFNESAASMSLNDTYTESIRKAGGIPVMLPLVKDSLFCERLLSNIDALILSGGEDVDPLRYGRDTIPECGYINGPRDTSDLMLGRCAIRHGIPILAICRGEQVMNVALGGTLIQDIPTEVDNHIAHSQSLPRTEPTHTIFMEGESVLKTILEGVDSIGVNSFHHQSVDDIAPGLTVTARASDGVVEAYEGFPRYDIIGVQFHPEGFAKNNDKTFLAVFSNLIERAKKANRK